MPRTTIAPVLAPGQFPTAGVTATGTAADTGNGNQVVASGKDLLIVTNTDVGSPPGGYNFTLSSVADEKNRRGDITDFILSGETKVYGPLPRLGWMQTDGYLYFAGADSHLQITVVALP
jgi:hypothetical protein